jgi:hypothetical protein
VRGCLYVNNFRETISGDKNVGFIYSGLIDTYTEGLP